MAKDWRPSEGWQGLCRRSRPCRGPHGTQAEREGLHQGRPPREDFKSWWQCEDIAHGGVPNPQGASFVAASYFENLIPLAEKYGLGEVVKTPSINFWATNSASDPGSQLSTAAFMLGTLKEITNSSSPEVNLGALFEVSL